MCSVGTLLIHTYAKQGFHVTGYSGKELPDDFGEGSDVVCWQCQQPTTATRETVTAMVIGGEALLRAGLLSQVSFAGLFSYL